MKRNISQMYGKFVGLILAATVAVPAVAHDFWLQPSGYRYPSPAEVPFSILVGHAADRQPWVVDRTRVVMFRSYGPDGIRDRRGEIVQQSRGGAGMLRFAVPGAYVVAFQSSPALSDLPALRFNDYAVQEGLTPALKMRSASGTMGANGRELYSRRAKTIVQIGTSVPAARSFVTRRLGLDLEIVPERDPMSLAANERLPVRIYYHGAPLPGALVKLTNLEFDAKPLASQRSDRQGRTTFAVPRAGSWLINVVWTRPIRGNPRGDFDTIFSSLSFGYTPGRGA